MQLFKSANTLCSF